MVEAVSSIVLTASLPPFLPSLVCFAGSFSASRTLMGFRYIMKRYCGTYNGEPVNGTPEFR